MSGIGQPNITNSEVTIPISDDGIKVSSSGADTYLVIKAADSLASSVTYTFPSTPAANRFLQTDGNGVLSWVAGGVSSPVTALNNQTANRLVSIGDTTTELDGEANLTFDGSTLSVAGTGTFSAGLSVKNGATSGGFVDFFEDSDNGTNKVRIVAPGTLAADYTLTLPVDAGTANYVLKTDGSGNLSWTENTGGGGGGGTITALNNQAENRLVTIGNTTTELDGEATLTFASNSMNFLADSSAIKFGVNSEITLTHVHNQGLTLKHTATSDDKPVILTLATGEIDIAVNDVIGTINFQAPNETEGTDAILVAAGIEAVSEGDFSPSNNATKLSFKTASSEAASEKMSLSSAGNLNVTGTIGCGAITSTGDMTIFDDTNNADASFSIGTSATEALVIQVLNGEANKTAEEVKFISKTASTTGNHGKMTFSIDESNVMEINDSGINVSGNLKLDETSGADVDEAGKGQLWVKDSIPNELYFTNDAGNDIQITGKSSLVGGFPSNIVVKTSTAWVEITETKAVIIKACGAGGGGGGTGSTIGDAGGGGGSGEYVEVYLDPSHIGSNTHIYCDIASGGAGGSDGDSNGVNASTTTIKLASNGSDTAGTVICTVFGGNGGDHGNAGGDGGIGGDGGEITTGTGFYLPGRNGDSGVDMDTTLKFTTGGNGGDSHLGRGGKAASWAAAAPTSRATGAAINGGGGGGGFVQQSGPTYRSSSAGASGVVMIYMY